MFVGLELFAGRMFPLWREPDKQFPPASSFHAKLDVGLQYTSQMPIYIGSSVELLLFFLVRLETKKSLIISVST